MTYCENCGHPRAAHLDPQGRKRPCNVILGSAGPGATHSYCGCTDFKVLDLSRTVSRGVAEAALAKINKPPGPPPTAPKPRMNKWETDFQAYYQSFQEGRGRFPVLYFEPVKLILAHRRRCTYTPDFLAVEDDNRLVFYEVKGHWRDDARVKIKVAAHQHPWAQFVAVTKIKGQWQFENI